MSGLDRGGKHRETKDDEEWTFSINTIFTK